MNFQDKISISLPPEDKKYIKEKANQNCQTMSEFIRSRLFDRTELRSENNYWNIWHFFENLDGFDVISLQMKKSGILVSTTWIND